MGVPQPSLTTLAEAALELLAKRGERVADGSHAPTWRLFCHSATGLEFEITCTGPNLPEAVSFEIASSGLVAKKRDWQGVYRLTSPLKKALLTGFHSTAKHNATKAVSPSSETMRTI